MCEDDDDIYVMIKMIYMRSVNVGLYVCLQGIDMSSLCFAEMSIYFRSGKFRAHSICPLFRKGHGEFFHDFDASN